MATSSAPVKSHRKEQHARRHRTPSSLTREAKTLRDLKKLDESLLAPKPDLIQAAREHYTLMRHEELEEVKLELKEAKGAPSRLRSPTNQVLVVSTPTPESKFLRTAIRSMFNKKQYHMRLATALNMSSSAAGIVNSTINVSTIGSSTDFTAFAGIFDEFFVVSVTCNWEPNGMYNGPLGTGGAPSTVLTSLPLGCASLQHTSAAYSSLASMSNNLAFSYHNTGRPFTHVWNNCESPSSTVLDASATQAWCPTGNASAYQGVIQFLSQSAPPALPASAVLGTFVAVYHVIFRARE